MIPYYETIIKNEIEKNPEKHGFNIGWKAPDFVLHKIPDCGITDDTTINNLALLCIDYMNRGIPVFIHCYGGHGRAGTLAGIILSKLTSWNLFDIRKYLQTVHDYRINYVECLCPQRPIQVTQLNRFIRK